MKKALAGAAAVVGVVVAVALSGSDKPRPLPMKYRADEMADKRQPVDAGILVGFESPCYREAKGDPACVEFLKRYPRGGVQP